ncbi:hypothetical protein MYAER_1317 [Microcystis aeruginosa NIES-2549]|uniref:Uncharacterized protein n=1 Tax=Microcystis aeruginosa NIES-2549 TaxID=1641812 RepID=A0A0F6RKA5_MICAE|nr:hypothetical protein MYAER_1317 [Microcystis aeruginosa NIES-2549]AOC52065.1 hypothetical protein amyaer_1330 [Microcystis aeruginosa NIES-2481]
MKFPHLPISPHTPHPTPYTPHPISPSPHLPTSLIPNLFPDKTLVIVKTLG